MKLKKVIQTEIDTAFLYHEMVELSDNPEIQNFYGARCRYHKHHL